MILPLLDQDFQKRFLFLLENLSCKWSSGELPTEKLYAQATYIAFRKRKIQYGAKKYSNFLNPNCLLGSEQMKYFPEDAERLNRFI